MVHVSYEVGSGSSQRYYRRGMAAQVSRDGEAEQEATTRSVMCQVCKALYTPAPAHQQLALAPHIVLESAFMSMCHFCFRCRRASCPDCWDAVHSVCGACVEEMGLPFRREVKPLGQIFPRSGQESQYQSAEEKRDNAGILACIQHGRFHRKPAEIQSPNFARPQRISRPMRVATADKGRDRFIASAPTDMQGRDRFIASASNSLQFPPTMEENGKGGRDKSVPTTVGRQPRGATYHYKPTFEDGQRKSFRASILSHGWVAEAMGAIEQWATGAMLILLLTIITMIVLAEASPSANAQMMHVFQIDIRGEVAYLIHLIGQFHW